MTVHRIPYRIVIQDSPGRSPIQVSVEPRVCDQPSRWFRDELDAAAFAEQLSHLEGWPIVDRRCGNEPPRAA